MSKLPTLGQANHLLTLLSQSRMTSETFEEMKPLFSDLFEVREPSRINRVEFKKVINPIVTGFVVELDYEKMPDYPAGRGRVAGRKSKKSGRFLVELEVLPIREDLTPLDDDKQVEGGIRLLKAVGLEPALVEELVAFRQKYEQELPRFIAVTALGSRIPDDWVEEGQRGKNVPFFVDLAHSDLSAIVIDEGFFANDYYYLLGVRKRTEI
jgi:hypothetical protein